jgi:hypothetical protein
MRSQESLAKFPVKMTRTSMILAIRVPKDCVEVGTGCFNITQKTEEEVRAPDITVAVTLKLLHASLMIAMRSSRLLRKFTKILVRKRATLSRVFPKSQLPNLSKIRSPISRRSTLRKLKAQTT